MSEIIDYVWSQKGFIYDPLEGLTFGSYHLIMMAITASLFVVIWIIGGHVKNKQGFLIKIALLLLVLEVLRVINFKYVFNRTWIGSISFHMCSIGIYMAIITGIFRKKWMFDMISLHALIGAPLALIIPTGILPWFNPYSFMPLQSFISHMLLFLMPLYAWRHQLWEVKLKHYYIPIISVLVSTGIAYGMSLYNLYYETGGSTNFFWTRMKEPFFDLVWNLPYPWYLFVLIGIFMMSGLIVYLVLILFQVLFKSFKRDKVHSLS